MLKKSLVIIAVLLVIVLILGAFIAYFYEDTWRERGRTLIDGEYEKEVVVNPYRYLTVPLIIAGAISLITAFTIWVTSDERNMKKRRY